MRNFGLPRVTSRSASSGAQHPPTGSHLREELTRNSKFTDGEGSLVVQRGGRSLSESQPAASPSFREGGNSSTRSRLTSHAPLSVADTFPPFRDRPNSRGSNRELSIDVRELAAAVLVGVVVTVAVGLPLMCILLYNSFIVFD